MKRLASFLLLWTGSLAAGACGDDETTAPTTASCVPTDPACPAVGIASECLSLVDNSGKDVFVLRLSQLSVTAPAALSTEIVKKIVAGGVNANLPACHIDGMGSFNLILQFDKTGGKLTAGASLPEESPEDGYCYVTDLPNGVDTVETDLTIDADGGFDIAPIEKITLPVYTDATATKVVYLPVSEATLLDGTISADQNCIGKYNAAKLEPENNCLPDDAAGVDYFENDASLEGYIRLADADGVRVDLVNQSLCVLLSGSKDEFGEEDPDEPGYFKCKTDADGFVFEGDWCSETNSAARGGCKDAMRLEAELAASGATLRDDCP